MVGLKCMGFLLILDWGILGANWHAVRPYASNPVGQHREAFPIAARTIVADER